MTESEKKKIVQHGDKSVYVEENTGSIHIHTPEGNVVIHNPMSEEGIAELKKAYGEKHTEIMQYLQQLEHQKSIPHALTANPFNPPDFIGREAELASLREQLTSGNTLLLLVNGEGGIGKTSLASRYYHRFKDSYNHVAWILNERSIGEALLNLAYKLNLQFGETLTTEERLSLLFTEMANLKAPCLLIIDNVNNPQNLSDHFMLLNRCSNFHILLTSRITTFANAQFFPIVGLPEQDAIQLFKRHFPALPAEDEDLLKEIISVVNHNTLILQLFAKNMQLQNELELSYSLSALKADIESSLLALSKSDAVLTAYQAKGGGLRSAPPEAIVLAMYDLSRLNEAEALLLSLFAILPNERVPFVHLQQLLPETDIKQAALALAQKGWTDYDAEDKSFKVNQVVQDVVRFQHRNRLSEDVKTAISVLTDFLSEERALHREHYANTLQHLSYAESALQALDQWPAKNLRVLCSYIGNFYLATGDLQQALRSYGSYAELAQRLLKTDAQNNNFKNGLAVSYEKLGETHSALGNLAKALQFFEERSKLGEELYEAYPSNVSFKNGLAVSYYKLAGIHRQKGAEIKIIRKWYALSADLWEQLTKAYPQYAEFQRNYDSVKSKLTELADEDDS